MNPSPRDEVGWKIIVTPGMIRGEIASVDTGIKQLAGDVVALYSTGALPSKWKDDWALFVEEWLAFKKEHTGFFSKVWSTGGIYDKTLEFGKRLADWRSVFIASGGKPTSPAPVVSFPDPSPVNWNHLIWLGAASILTWGVVSVTRSVKGK